MIWALVGNSPRRRPAFVRFGSRTVGRSFSASLHGCNRVAIQMPRFGAYPSGKKGRWQVGLLYEKLHCETGLQNRVLLPASEVGLQAHCLRADASRDSKLRKTKIWHEGLFTDMTGPVKIRQSWNVAKLPSGF